MSTGRLGVASLNRFWFRHCTAQTDAGEWVRDNTLLAGLRVGPRETFEFLLQSKPSLQKLLSIVETLRVNQALARPQ